MLLAPSGLYAGIPSSNHPDRSAPATPRERGHQTGRRHPSTARRMALWGAGLVGTSALLLGGLTAAGLGWTIRHAITQAVPGSVMTIPWAALASIVVTALLLALAAGLAGSAAATRHRVA